MITVIRSVAIFERFSMEFIFTGTFLFLEKYRHHSHLRGLPQLMQNRSFLEPAGYSFLQFGQIITTRLLSGLVSLITGLFVTGFSMYLIEPPARPGTTTSSRLLLAFPDDTGDDGLGKAAGSSGSRETRSELSSFAPGITL